MVAFLRNWKPWVRPRHPATAVLAGCSLLGAMLIFAAAISGSRDEAPTPPTPSQAAVPVTTVAAVHTSVVPDCLRGEEWVHDVRWAAVCKRMEELGQGDGYAECQLPDEHAAKLYALLRQGEQRCMAELKTASVR